MEFTQFDLVSVSRNLLNRLQVSLNRVISTISFSACSQILPRLGGKHKLRLTIPCVSSAPHASRAANWIRAAGEEPGPISARSPTVGEAPLRMGMVWGLGNVCSSIFLKFFMSRVFGNYSSQNTNSQTELEFGRRSAMASVFL